MQPGREHPWNIRRLSHRHLHDYRNLQDLHLMAAAWYAAIGHERVLSNPFDAEPSLEDDTWPEDVLRRVERRVHQLELKSIGEPDASADKLAEASYQSGQESASRRWTQADPTEGSIAPADKRSLLLALYHSPLGGLEGPGAFLVRRSLVTEVSVELLACPHRLAERARDSRGESAESGNDPFASAPAETLDRLCQQQFNWLRGYFGFLNPALTPALSRPRGRCVVSW